MRSRSNGPIGVAGVRAERRRTGFEQEQLQRLDRVRLFGVMP